MPVGFGKRAGIDYPVLAFRDFIGLEPVAEQLAERFDISREEQAARLEARREDPLKKFKISALDGVAQARWDDYSTARDQMLWATHTGHSPWTIVGTDRKKDARLGIMSHVLSRLERPGREKPIVPDPDIVFPFHEAEGRMAP